jgi:pyruvate/2-oxoglutarate dehydrogenase complex dihydrolipoamide acyltransferase (E2) component
MIREWRDTQPTVASAAAFAEHAEGEQQPDRRDWRQRLREAAQERQRLFEAQVADGTLRVRRVTGPELDRLRADAERYRREHPEDAVKAAKRPSRPVQPKPPPEPLRPRVCALEGCDEVFMPRTRHQRYCGTVCGGRASWARQKARRAKAAA